ncbi:MAG: hypothetical protein HY901_04425, partial [Deltaproteobacteria bacterium]|nr:hypothetical protein [Deltaproteobacteria bacterium]
MRILFIALSFAFVLTSCSNAPPPVATTCRTNSDCAAKQFCIQAVCIADEVGPVISITSPAASALFSTPTASLAGTVSDGDGAGVATLEYSLGDGPYLPLTFQADKFEMNAPLPEVDRNDVTLRIRAIDAVGNSSSATVTFKVDRIAPSITFTPFEKTRFNAADVGTSVVLKAQATDQGAVASLEWSLDGGATWAASASPTEFTHTLVVEALTDVTRVTLTARATDDVGNTSQPVSSETITLDTIAPVVEITGPSDNAFYSSGNSFELTGTFSETALDRIVAALDGQPLTLELSSGAFHATVPLAEEDNTDHVIVVTAFDEAGNRADDELRYTVDKFGPAIAIASPAENSVFNLDDASPMLVTGSITGQDLASSTYQLLPGGAEEPLPLVDGSFTVSVPLPTEDYTEHSIVFKARDLLDQDATRTLHFAVDRVKPVLSIASPTPDQVFSGATSSMQIMGTAVDASAAILVEVTVDGAPVTVDRAGNAFSATVVLAQEDRRSHTVAIKATDSAGNEQSATLSYTVDRQAPVITISAPQNNAIFGLDDPASIEVVGTVTDAALDSLTYRIPPGAETTVTVTGGAFSIPLSFANEDWTQHEIHFTARDIAGNERTSTLRYTVDRLAPVISVTTPTEGQVLGLSVATPFAAGGSVEDLGFEQMTYQLDGGAAQSITSTGAFSIPITLSNTEDYVPHRLVLSARDRAGNSTSLTRQYHVDRVAPQLTLTSPSANATCADTCGPAASVVNASATSLTFSGSASDGSALTFAGTLDSTAVTPEYSNGSWSYAWAAPADNGMTHTFTITATDRGGNATSAPPRTVYVDRVVPTLSMLVNNQRLLSRSADLFRFSEPMDVASVLGATTVAPSGPVLTSSDKMTFKAQAPTSFVPYREYHIAVAVGAKDKAGNPIASPGEERFRTETVAPPTG